LLFSYFVSDFRLSEYSVLNEPFVVCTARGGFKKAARVPVQKLPHIFHTRNLFSSKHPHLKSGLYIKACNNLRKIDSQRHVWYYVRVMKKPKQKFNVIVEQDEDGYYVASVPSLPGCYTQAKTFDDLVSRIKEAISLCLSVAGENPKYGRRIKTSVPQPGFIGIQTVEV